MCQVFLWQMCILTNTYKNTFLHFNSLYQQFLWHFFCLKFCHWSSPRKPSSGLSSALPHPWHFTGLSPAHLCQYCTGEPRTGPSIPEMSHRDWTEGKDHLPLSPANALLVTRAFLDFLLTKRAKSKPTNQTNKNSKHVHPKQTNKLALFLTSL